MNKKKLYEHIMSNVAKQVKKSINESFDPAVDALWNHLQDEHIATEAELQLVTDINGYSIESLNDILYARTGYRNWEQYMDMDNE